MVGWTALSQSQKEIIANNIRSDYSMGLSLPVIANKYKLSRSCIHKILKLEIIQIANKINKRPGPKIYGNNIKGERTHKDLSNDDIKKILSEYHDGSTITDLCIKYNINNTMISHILKTNNVDIRSSKRISEYEINNIIINYKNGHSIQKIAMDMNINYMTVSKILKMNNVDIRGKMSLLNDEQILDIIKRYLNGESVINLGNDYKVHPNTIYRVLKQNNILNHK